MQMTGQSEQVVLGAQPGIQADLPTNSYSEAKQRFMSKVNGMAKTPREQLNEFKKRNRPAIILKMKPVNASSSQGQPNILRKPQHVEQVFGQKGLQHQNMRQRSNPHKVKQSKLMIANYPFFFSREEPAKLSEAPEWYQNRGRKDDGLVAKNTHAPLAGQSFPSNFASSYQECVQDGATRGNESSEQTKLKQTKIGNNIIKKQITQDNIQNLIYDLKAGKERFEQSSRVQDERGLGFREATVRGNVISLTDKKIKLKHHAVTTTNGSKENLVQDNRFALPNSVKGNFNEQLILFTDMPVEVRKKAERQQTLSMKNTQVRAQYNKTQDYRASLAQDEGLSMEVKQRLNDSYNEMIIMSKANRSSATKDNVPLDDPRLSSQFEPHRQGQKAPYSDLMKNFKPGSLMFKHAPTPGTVRMGVLDPETVILKRQRNKTVVETSNKQLEKSGTKSTKSKLVTQVSQNSVGQGLVSQTSLRDRKNLEDKQIVTNKKNFSVVNHNYSYRVQMQRQINKVKKHQPNASLSKLIDLGEFQADSKINGDLVIRNIAENFKQHRANLRHGVVNTAESGSRTPYQTRPQLLLPAGQSPQRALNNSVSPSPKAAPGSLFNQNDWNGSATEEQWKINTAGTNEWKKNSQATANQHLSPLRMQEQLSQSSHASIAPSNYARSKPTSRGKGLAKRTNMRSSISQGNPANKRQDPFSRDSNQNPFKASAERNKIMDRSTSIMFKTRGAEKSADHHYSTTHKVIERNMRVSREGHLLPKMQPVALKNERGFNSVRNKKVSVLAINSTNAGPLKHQSKLKDPEPSNFVVHGKKAHSSIRPGEKLRDSIQNINQERIAAQAAQSTMHSQHVTLKPIRQYQTLQVFKEKRPACFSSNEDQARSATLYNKTISAKKDLYKMKIKAAGINRDTLATRTQMKTDEQETSFKTSFQKQLDTYQTNNGQLLPRHKLSAAMLQEQKALKESSKAKDLKTSWNLRQISQLSQQESPSKSIAKNEADRQLLEHFQERQVRKDTAFRQSQRGSVNVGTHMSNNRLSPVPMMGHQSPVMHNNSHRSGILLAQQKDLQVGSRFGHVRNESARMSLSLHSEKGRWYDQTGHNKSQISPMHNQPGNSRLSNRNNSFQIGMPMTTKNDNLETRSNASRQSFAFA